MQHWEKNYNYIFIYLLYALIYFVTMTSAIHIIFYGINVMEKVFDGASTKNNNYYQYYYHYYYCYNITFRTFLDVKFYIF